MFSLSFYKILKVSLLAHLQYLFERMKMHRDLWIVEKDSEFSKHLPELRNALELLVVGFFPKLTRIDKN